MSNKYEIGIIGGGVAGAFAALRIAEHHKKKKCILFELGRPARKRRRQLESWFGCFPFGDGKIYPGDSDKLSNIVHNKRIITMSKWFQDQLDNINKSKVIKNKLPSISAQKKFKEHGYELIIHDYYQWKPEHIHQLSGDVYDRIEKVGNVEFSFDNEVYSIMKNGTYFNVSTADGDFQCKKLLMCVGRSGWRWVNKVYKNLGILIDDDIAEYGVRIELPAQYLKDFNKSHCTLKKGNLTLGPFSWSGQVIQEDHADMTIASFRSNEERWKSNKVFFSMMLKRDFPGQGCYQTDRLAKLAFVLSQDRVGREKIKSFTKNDSQLSFIPEYDWMNEYFVEIEKVVPSIINRGYFHCPDIYPITANIRISPNLETEIPGLFVAGESAGVMGIVAAGVSGAIAAESIVK